MAAWVERIARRVVEMLREESDDLVDALEVARCPVCGEGYPSQDNANVSDERLSLVRNAARYKQALERIVADDGEEDGIHDEWSEAAGFARIQKLAQEALRGESK